MRFRKSFGYAFKRRFEIVIVVSHSLFIGIELPGSTTVIRSGEELP